MSLPQRAELPLGLLLLLPDPGGVLPVTSLGNSSCPALLAQPRGEAWAVAGSVQPPPGTQAFWPISSWTGGWARAGGGARGTSRVQRGWRKPRKEGPASLGRCLLGGPWKSIPLQARSQGCRTNGATAALWNRRSRQRYRSQGGLHVQPLNWAFAKLGSWAPGKLNA